MIEAILIDNTSRFALVGIDMRFEKMLNSLKFLNLFLANLIRSKFIFQFLMSKIKDNLFFLNRDINQKQIKYRINFMNNF